MFTGKQIKIIKRAERNDSKTVASVKRRTNVRNPLEQTKRDAVRVVTEWIDDLRRKKAEEAARELEGLFGKAA